jgi:hypothetical protein
MGGFPTLGKEDSSTPAPQSYQNQSYQNREAMIATQWTNMLYKWYQTERVMRSNEYESSAMSHTRPANTPFGMSKTPSKKAAEQGQATLATSQIIKYVMFLNVWVRIRSSPAQRAQRAQPQWPQQMTHLT